LVVALLALAFLIGALGYLNQSGLLNLQETPRQILADFYASASVELAGIAIIILIVESLFRRRETDREKRQLILQLASSDSASALDAWMATGWVGQ
jgi:hypothetical protein